MRLRQILILVSALFANSVLADVRIYTIEEPPFNFVDEQGELTGISVDFIREVQRRVGDDSEIELMFWARAYQIAQTESDVILFTATRAKYREPLFRWLAPVVRNAWRFYTVDGQYPEVDDLEVLKSAAGIGVLRSGAREAYLKERGFENIVATKSLKQINKMLDKNRLPLIFFAEAGLATTSYQQGIDMARFSPVYTVYPPASYILMSKATSESTFLRWKKAANQIKADGTYQRIANKWIRYLKEYYGISAHHQDGALNLWDKD